MIEPIRTCVACRTRQPQRALVRLRRRSDGVIVPSLGRSTQGRSAYLCPQSTCFERAVRRGSLARAFGRRRTFAAPSASVETLRSQVVAALDLEVQTLQRSGKFRPSPRHDALESLRRGLDEPGRSA